MADPKKKKNPVIQSVEKAFKTQDTPSVGHTKVDEGYEPKPSFGAAITKALQKRKAAAGGK